MLIHKFSSIDSRLNLEKLYKFKKNYKISSFISSIPIIQYYKTIKGTLVAYVIIHINDFNTQCQTPQWKMYF
jgi:hypothetical protein